MPSASLRTWITIRTKALDDIELMHRRLGGTGPGRRFRTEQLNRGYTVLLSSEFQAFCRDLHTEAYQRIVAALNPTPQFQVVLASQFTYGRRLDHGNPNPGNLGSDFGRLGVNFIDAVKKRRHGNAKRLETLQNDLNEWRNAIAHNDYSGRSLGGRTFPLLRTIQGWRSVCTQLAREFDEVVRVHLAGLLGSTPW